MTDRSQLTEPVLCGPMCLRRQVLPTDVTDGCTKHLSERPRPQIRQQGKLPRAHRPREQTTSPKLPQPAVRHIRKIDLFLILAAAEKKLDDLDVPVEEKEEARGVLHRMREAGTTMLTETAAQFFPRYTGSLAIVSHLCRPTSVLPVGFDCLAIARSSPSNVRSWHRTCHRFALWSPAWLPHRSRLTSSERVLIGLRRTGLSPCVWSEPSHHGDPRPTRGDGQATAGPRGIRAAVARPS